MLSLIQEARPDLRLHGFGLKATALEFAPIREMLHTADSMAWSFAARKQGRDGNDWREAKGWLDGLTSLFDADRRTPEALSPTRHSGAFQYTLPLGGAS